MSTSFVLILAAVASLLLILRLVVPGLPIRKFARRLTPLDLALAAVGVLGLILHCASMFFGSVVAAIPGSGSAIDQINSMGSASMIWYAVPALMVLTGLRRQHQVALILLSAALLAVGVTMYNGTALSTHLDTIFAAGSIIAATVFLLSRPSWSRRPATNHTVAPPAKPQSSSSSAMNLCSHADVLSFIGHTLGFWPQESLVCITLADNHVGPTLRVDLPKPKTEISYAKMVAGYLGQDTSAESVLFAVYTHDGWRDQAPWIAASPERLFPEELALGKDQQKSCTFTTTPP